MWCVSLRLTWSRVSLPNAALSTARLQSSVSTSIGENQPALPFDAMPGPKSLPFIGNSLELRKNLDQLRVYFQKGFEKYGKIYRVKGMGNYNVLVKDPSTLEKVLRAEGKYPVRDTTFVPNFRWLASNRSHNKKTSFTFIDGEQWKEIRSGIGKQISPRVAHSFHDGYSHIIHRFIKYIRSTRLEDGTIKDIDPPFRRLLVDLSSLTVFGSEVDCVGNPTPETEEFIAAIQHIFLSFAYIMVSLPLYKLYDNKLSRDFRAAGEILDRYSRPERERIRALVAAGKKSSQPGILEQWLREGKISEEIAMHEANSLFPAGVDATSNQAVFMIHAIAANEDVQEELYKEIKTVLGDHELPLLEHLSKMPYMKGCLLETYRLYGANAQNVRVLQEDTVLHGYQVPANTTVTYALYAAGRDESLFPNPLKFDPKRWKRDDSCAFAMQPFGFGPRGCYGRRFAELELKNLLIQLVKNFKMSSDIKELDSTERAIVVSPKGEIPIRFEDRNN